jgi:hypothetical protein
MHIIFNVQMQFKDHWCNKLLENTKELALLLALLLPMTSTLKKCIVVGVIYQWEGRTWMKPFQEQNYKAMPRVPTRKKSLEEQLHEWMFFRKMKNEGE